VAILDDTDVELRGWEWRYLHRLCHSDLDTFKGHSGAVTKVAWHEDGSRFVTSSTDGTTKVWDVKSGRELFTLSGRLAYWGGKKNSVYVTLVDSNTAAVWDGERGSRIYSLPQSNLASASINADGTRIITVGTATAGQYSGSVTLWDLNTGKKINTSTGYKWY
jgi:WD40 repeat protein